MRKRQRREKFCYECCMRPDEFVCNVVVHGLDSSGPWFMSWVGCVHSKVQDVVFDVSLRMYCDIQPNLSYNPSEVGCSVKDLDLYSMYLYEEHQSLVLVIHRFYGWVFLMDSMGGISYGFYGWVFLTCSDGIYWYFYRFLQYLGRSRTLLIFIHKNTPAKITLENEQNSAITQHQLPHYTSTTPRPWDFRLPSLSNQSNNQPQTLASLIAAISSNKRGNIKVRHWLLKLN